MGTPLPTTRSARRRLRRRRSRRRAVAASSALVVVLAGGLGAYLGTRGDDTRHVAAPSTKSTTTTAATTTTTRRDPRRGDGQAVTFAFGGDVHFEGALRAKLLANPATVLAPIAPVLSGADLAVVNLETAITDRGTAVAKAFDFRAPASALDALKAGGIDAATEANNHGLDYGPVGLADSLAASQQKQFPLLGIGANATQAYAPFQTVVKGQRIAIIGATDVIDGEYIKAWSATDAQGGLASAKDLPRLVAAVQAARATSDTVVVFLHWGVEKQSCPTARQKELSRALVDAGADIVVGSHSHLQEGGGHLGSAFVDYGLGNFAFYNESGDYGRSGVLLVTATGRDISSYQWVPARIRGAVPQPVPPGRDADAELAHWNGLRGCTDLAA